MGPTLTGPFFLISLIFNNYLDVNHISDVNYITLAIKRWKISLNFNYIYACNTLFSKEDCSDPFFDIKGHADAEKTSSRRSWVNTSEELRRN